MSKRILVLASGGDSAGMNACVESIFIACRSRGWQAMGAIGGYEGLVTGNIVMLTPDNARNIGHMTGCTLKAGRSESFMTKQGQDSCLQNLNRHKINCVIVLGGNGSFKGATTLEKLGVPVIGIPCTIDNDVYFTRESLGFSSAVEESVRLIDRLKGTMQTNDRDHVVQLMGWHEKGLTQMVGEATFAEIIDTIDNRHTPKQVIEIFDRNRKAGNTSNMMVMQEKRKDSIDVVSEALEAVNYLQDLTRLTPASKIRLNTLGHLQRGATPSGRDRWLGHHYGKKAIELIEAGQSGVAVGMVRENVIAVPLAKSGQKS